MTPARNMSRLNPWRRPQQLAALSALAVGLIACALEAAGQDAGSGSPIDAAGTATAAAPRRPSIGAPQNIGAPMAAEGAIARPRKAPTKAAPAQPAVQADGCGSPGALGVSRVETIDATSGPRYGHQQFTDIDFLHDGEIVLTFDDGPLRPHTSAVLKALEAHCTKATFFVVGRMALADPAMVRETAQRGHTIGTHTWSHMDLRKTNASRARGEIELGFSAVTNALGHPVAPFFRFPYLSSPKSMLDYTRERRIADFSIEVDSNDYRTKDPGSVHRQVLSQLEHTKKGIILFHDIQPSTAHALKGLLDELKARNFKVVHLVASAPATTLPEFDAIAAKEAARKSGIASADPLATRSVVWPVAGAKSAPPLGEEDLPWGGKAVKHTTIVPQPRPKASAPPPDDDNDWLGKIFKF